MVKVSSIQTYEERQHLKDMFFLEAEKDWLETQMWLEEIESERKPAHIEIVFEDKNVNAEI